MEPLTITYRFVFPDGNQAIFEVRIDPVTLEAVAEANAELPDWTRLEFSQCPHCPLTPESHPHCPLAASLSQVVARFESILSYEDLTVEAITEERTVSKCVSAQQGLSALMGLIMPTSGCPYTSFFKPMARFHLPMASGQETVYRAASMYLLSQYFAAQEGQQVDLGMQGLVQIYEDIQTLNRAMAERIRRAVSQDAAVNAIVVLDFFAQSLPLAIEDHLAALRPLFKAYFDRPPTAAT
jgi:hypothetical protein